jgi:hypothetical protein
MATYYNGKSVGIAADAIKWFADKASFPIPGGLKFFYGAEDEGVVYFWDADKGDYEGVLRASEKGAQFGLAELDATLRLKKEQVPLDVMYYKGALNPDMFEWQVANFTSNNFPFRAAKNDSMIITVGGSGLIARSINGKDWTASNVGTSNRSGIAWSPTLNMWAAVRQANVSSVSTSPDGINWTDRNGSGNLPVLVGIAWGGDRFVAVGFAGFAISTNGTSWTFTQNFGLMAYGVTYAVDRFVAVGVDGKIWTSPTGSVWTLKATLGPVMTNVTFGKGTLVASAENGSVYYSTDLGESWTEVVIDPLDKMKGISFGRNKFIVCGKLTSYTSLDGVTWTHLPMDPDSEGNPDNYYEDTIYGEELYPGFLAFGRFKNGGVTVGRIIRLDDAETGRVYEVTEDIIFEGIDLKKGNLILATSSGWIVFNPQIGERYFEDGLITGDILISKEIELSHEPKDKIVLNLLSYPQQLQDHTFTVAGKTITLSNELVSILRLNVPYQIYYWG